MLFRSWCCQCCFCFCFFSVFQAFRSDYPNYSPSSNTATTDLMHTHTHTNTQHSILVEYRQSASCFDYFKTSGSLAVSWDTQFRFLFPLSLFSLPIFFHLAKMVTIWNQMLLANGLFVFHRSRYFSRSSFSTSFSTVRWHRRKMSSVNSFLVPPTGQ